MTDKSILVVEDDVDISALIKKKLFDSGLQPFMLETGRQALDYLENHKPAVIVLDILLPDIDGVTVLTELAHNQKTKDIPIIIFSNLADEGSLEQVKAVGRYDYYVKSKTDLNTLAAKIKEKIN